MVFRREGAVVVVVDVVVVVLVVLVLVVLVVVVVSWCVVARGRMDESMEVVVAVVSCGDVVACKE